jgi:fibronectin-binding autotransporter adhesin
VDLSGTSTGNSVTGVIGGGTGTISVNKLGTSTWALTAANTYTGATTVSGGTLLVNGSLASGSAVTVTNATLGGTGSIGGATTLQPAAILNAGINGVGTLTFNNSLTLNATSTNLFVVTTAGGASNQVAVTSGTLSPNSSIVEINTGGTQLGAGTNVLFTYSSEAGSFNLAPRFVTPQTGLATNAYILDASSQIELVVTNLASAPPLSGLKFTAGPVISGTSLTISATNTGAGTVYLLTSTNVAAPISTWTPVWTNVLGGNGSFTTNLLNVVNPSLGHQFYILSNTNN